MILKRLVYVSALALVTGNILGCASSTSEGRVLQAGLCPTLAHIQACLQVGGSLTSEDTETFHLLATEESHVPEEHIKQIWREFVDLYNGEKAARTRQEPKLFPAVSPEEITVDIAESKPLSKKDDFINIVSNFSRSEQRLYKDGYITFYHALAGQVYYLQRFYWPEFFKQLGAYAGNYMFRAGVLHTLNPNTLRPFESVDDLMKYYEPVSDSRVMDAGIYCNALLSGGRETSLSGISSAYMFDTFGSVTPKGILQLLTPFFVKFGMNRDLAKRISQDVEKLYDSQCKECGNALVQIGLPHERANQLASFIWADGSKYDPRIAPLFKDFLSSPDSECELSFLHYMLECIDNRKGKLNGRVNDVINASLTDRLLDLGRCVIKSQISKEAVRKRFLETVVEYKKLKPFSFEDWNKCLTQTFDKKDLSLADTRALTNEVLLFSKYDLYEYAKIFSSFRYPEKYNVAALQKDTRALVEKHVRFLTLQKCQPLSVFLPLHDFFRDGEIVNTASVNTTFVLLLMNSEYVEAEVLVQKYGRLKEAWNMFQMLIKQGTLPPAACCASALIPYFPKENAFALGLYESLISPTK